MPRQPISDIQRKALRQWFQHQYPQPRQRDCMFWFKNKFNHQITQSTVSEILSDRYLYLDQGIEPSKPTFRQRTANWPILEEILFNWQQNIERQGGLITGDILCEKAREIWCQIPQYNNIPSPEFSTGWLSGFKKRYNLYKRTQHGEASSVSNTAAEEMKAVQTLAGEYEEDNIYNMDETGLFWRQAPSSGLSTQNRPGIKKDKSRITLVACANSTGSDRLPVWFIGNAKTPRSLHGLNIRALGGIWQANKKAWMTTIIMKEWLLSFYSHIGSRSVLLLMDNFLPHIQGAELAPPPSNIRIQWLPANSTSLYQPLDQGIINNLKTHYRKRWLRFMIDHYEVNLNPLDKIMLYDTVHWIIRIWNHEISKTTIYNCFRKSGVIQPQIQNLPTEPAPDLSVLYRQAQHAGQIRDMMALESFLNPSDENVVDSHDGTDLNTIIADHLEQGETIEAAEQSDEEEPLPPPSIQQALNGLHVLLRYKEYCQDTKMEDIRLLEQLQHQLVCEEVNSRPQKTLDSWLRHH